MAASLTCRRSNSNGATSNSKHYNASASSWQDLSVPRRRPDKPPSLNGSSTSNEAERSRPFSSGAAEPTSSTRINDERHSSSLERDTTALLDNMPRKKRPRNQDVRGKHVPVGEARRSSSTLSTGDYHSTHTPSPSSSIHSTMIRKGATTEEKRTSNDSGSKAARRSSVESTTSTNSSGSGGFRRLKKFGKKTASTGTPSPTKKSPPKKPSPSKSSSPDKDALSVSVSETFQQTQLRLWKAAQERHQQLQEEQEKKRLKKLQKKKLREQMQQERQKKHQGTGIAAESDVEADSDPRRESTKQSKKKRRESIDSHSSSSAQDLVSSKQTKRGSMDSSSSQSEKDGGRKIKKKTSIENTSGSSMGMDSSQRSTDSERDALKAKKKLKKLKKLQRLSEGEQSTTFSSMESIATGADEKKKFTTSSSSSSTMSVSETNAETKTPEQAIKKKKKKRRLVKLGSNDDDDDDAPRKKKKKINPDVDLRCKGEDEAKQNIKAKVPSTPERKLTTTSSFDAAPLTPLSLGLADTVKTRVRSCSKFKDELEILQAASFEKKKRKKNKHSKKEVAGEGVKKQKLKKKKMKQQLLFTDSKVSEPYADVSFSKKSGRERRGEEADDSLYDADVEAGSKKPSFSFKKEGQKGKGVKPLETMSEVAASETSSSTTVVTGKIKKKKKRPKKSNTKGFVTSHDIANSFDQEDGRHHQPLPLKKRMAIAAAAAESSSWNVTSTAASKVSISSAGTGPNATPEFSTEASSISEFTHPLGSMALPPPPASCNASPFPKPSPVPREILSKTTVASSHALPFDFGVSAHNTVIGPTISSSDDSDSESSSDSDTDDEELFSWANKMFGTSAKPPAKKEEKCAHPIELNLTPDMCEMERRRQKQEEARTLSLKEVNAILKEEEQSADPAAGHWVRRSVRQPSRSLLNAPLVRKLLDKLRGNDSDMVVLKMKKYLSDPDTPSMLIDTALEALEECTNCEALYIQNFNIGMKDKQVLHLLRILQMPSCNIWCLNIGETYNVTEDTWEIFAEGLKKTKVTHMYASEHTITAELKDEIRETIRLNRRKHNMHNDPNNLDVIVQCTHCWWNPINAKVLRPFLRKRGFESLLNDREAQGLRGSMSEAPAL